jgi:hypothetical protein
MNIVQAKDVVRLGYRRNKAVFFFGPPGVGKSQAIYQVAEEAKVPMGVLEKRTSTSSPDESGDIKYVIDGVVKSAPQDWIPTEEKIKEGVYPERGLIFLDEMLDGPLSMQSAYQQMVLDRRLDSAKIAPGWLPVGASNDRKHKAAAGRMSSALASRFMIVEIEADTDVTVQHALKKKWNTMVPACLRWMPELVSTFDPKSNDRSYACPRSWESVSDIISDELFNKFTPSIKMEIISGIIGTVAAIKFISFMELYTRIPDLSELKRNPTGIPVPYEPAIIYALIGALLRNVDGQSFQDYWGFVSRLSPEYITVYVRDAISANGEVQETKAFDEYVAKYGQLLF